MCLARNVTGGSRRRKADSLDLFDALMRTTFSQATREGQQERLRTIHDLAAAVQVLSEACQVVLVVNRLKVRTQILG